MSKQQAGPEQAGPVTGIADALAGIVELRRLADRVERQAVDDARRLGWTWSRVANVVGVSRQSMHKKYGARQRRGLKAEPWSLPAGLKQCGEMLRRALELAGADGLRSVEPEHLLLAVASSPDGTGALLGCHALGPEQLRQALARHRERGLTATGVDLADPSLRPHLDPLPPAADLSAPCRRVLERAARSAADRGDHAVAPADVLVSLLESNLGTVPRALALAGVDPDELRRAAEGLLS